ncbi:MAG: hypothetical protein ACYTJ0_21360 [Planctomycetota bacterium]|jgi:hypothetical protein
MRPDRPTIPIGSRGRAALATLLVAASTIGCQTTVTSRDGRPLPPEPRRAPNVPDSAVVNALAMRVGLKPSDSNSNGYPDLIPVEIYLFASPHATAVHKPGAFEFRLYISGQATDDADVSPLATWRFEGEQEASARFRSPMFGLGYAFRLSLLESGQDELPLMPGTLVCRFEPAGGGPAVDSTGDHTIQIGSGR